MNYKKSIPENTFIGKYLRYMEVIETPVSYDFWCAVWLLGVLLGRSVFVNRPITPVYLNWYLILAAQSGTTRKSTAVKTVRRLGQSAGANIFTGKLVPEELEDRLQEQTYAHGSCSASIAAPELVSVLGRESYMRTMPGLLTDLYDCPDYREGRRIIKNVFVNLLSASTPAWLVSAVNPSVIEGGFTSRVLFIHEHRGKRRIAWPSEHSEGVELDLLEALVTIVAMGKAIKKIGINDAALKEFTRWYNARVIHHDLFRSSFEAREDDHVLALGATLCINDGTLEIQKRHIKTSIRIVEHVKQGAVELFTSEYSPAARYGAGIDQLRKVLVEAGMDGLNHTQLYMKCRRKLDREEYNILIKILHECGMIQVFDRGRKSSIYRATQKLEAPGQVSSVLAVISRHQD